MTKKLPSALSNFKKVVGENCVYIDKTAAIHQLEQQGSYHLLTRPHGFGKSLFLSMLEHYYDVRHASDFETLFSDLAIGKYPTASKNSYQVLFLEFAHLTGTTPEAICASFTQRLEQGFLAHLQRYQYPAASYTTIQTANSAAAKTAAFFTLLAKQKILLLLDNYNGFAEELALYQPALWQALKENTEFLATLKAFYSSLQTATQRGCLDRVLLVGVTSLLQNDVEQAFPALRVITTNTTFTQTFGFNHNEAEILCAAKGIAPEQTAASLKTLQTWYGGYRFAAGAQAVLHPALTLDCLDKLSLGTPATPEPIWPQQMVSGTAAVNVHTLTAALSNGINIENHKDKDNDDSQTKTIFYNLINTGKTTSYSQLLNGTQSNNYHDNLVKLLAYLGLATWQETSLLHDVFVLPNQAVRSAYYQYYLQQAEELYGVSYDRLALAKAIEALGIKNDIEPFLDQAQQVITQLAEKSNSIKDKQSLKTLLLALLYQFPVYFIDSEYTDAEHIPDIVLRYRSPFALQHQHLIELKYCPKSDGGETWEAGVAQTKRYLQQPEIAHLAELSAWLLLTDGGQLVAQHI